MPLPLSLTCQCCHVDLRRLPPCSLYSKSKSIVKDMAITNHQMFSILLYTFSINKMTWQRVFGWRRAQLWSMCSASASSSGVFIKYLCSSVTKDNIPSTTQSTIPMVLQQKSKPSIILSQLLHSNLSSVVSPTINLPPIWESQQIHIYHAIARENQLNHRFFVQALVHPGHLHGSMMTAEYLISKMDHLVTSILDALKTS